MSQQFVDAYFNTRKRTAADDSRTRNKVIILDGEQQAVNVSNNVIEVVKNTGLNQPDDSNQKTSPKVVFNVVKEALLNNQDSKIDVNDHRNNILRANRVVRNIQFDSPNPTSSPKTPKTNSKARVTRAKKTPCQEGQADIRKTFIKLTKDGDDATTPRERNVVFEKKGALSPQKKGSATPHKQKVANSKVEGKREEQPAAGSLTPKKTCVMDTLARQELSLGEIKNKITRSARLAELRASIAKINKCAAKLDEIQARKEAEKPEIKKFEKIELEVPVSPQKSLISPRKNLLTPTKNVDLPKNASPQRKLLFSPKESTPSPVKTSPTKLAAYQRYQSLVESGTPALSLPYNYRFLAEMFRCVDTVASLLFNRRELITFKKLKPAVQEMMRRNFTLEHLAQIKTVYPNAFVFNHEKVHNFGSSSKQDKYELVITPMVESKNGRNTPDADNVLKSASEMSMCPTVLLERRRIFYKTLLDMVKDHHEKFILGLDPPMVIPKEKITRWHPEFDVESCPVIEQSELPKPPNVEKATTAKDVLQKAKSLFNCNTRMEKALQRLAEAKMTTKSSIQNSTADAITQVAEQGLRKVEISIVDTPPATPTTHQSHLNPAFKGIPKALLEKVRAKQAAKAFESMTRTPSADKEATRYSRLPELAKILRNIFVGEKKGVLTMEFVIKKLDNSYRAKLTNNELEDHIKLLCKLLPTWASLHNVRKIDYLKLSKDLDINKVVKRLEIMANDKVNS